MIWQRYCTVTVPCLLISPIGMKHISILGNLLLLWLHTSLSRCISIRPALRQCIIHVAIVVFKRVGIAKHSSRFLRPVVTACWAIFSRRFWTTSCGFLVRRHRDPACAPIALSSFWPIFFVKGSISPAQDLADKKSTTQIVRVDHSSIAQLHSLSCVVYPSKVGIQQRLYHAEHNRYRFGLTLFGDSTLDPVPNIQCAISAQREKVERVDDRWDARLAEKKELWQNANRLKYERERSEELRHLLTILSLRNCHKLTSQKDHSSFFMNMSIAKGASSSEPPRHAPPNFQAFSRSLVRGNTLIMMNMM